MPVGDGELAVERPSTSVLFWSVALVGLLLDQGTKVWAFAAATESPLSVISGYVAIRPCLNTGATWGMGQGHNALLLLLTTGGICAIVAIRHWWHDTGPAAGAALGAMLGGALGNLVDRISRGAVRDFIDLHAGMRYTWPTFNVADALICAGAVVIMVTSILAPRSPQKGVAADES